MSVSKIRPRHKEHPTSISLFVRMITIVSLFMSPLDLILAIPRACELSEISSQPVLIRVVQPWSDWTPSGREDMLIIPCLADISYPRICVPASDAMSGSIGEGVEEVLSMKRGKRIQIQGL